MQLRGLSHVVLLNPVSAANTAAATSSWIDITSAEGDILIILSVGALTGSIAWALNTATDASGTGSAAVTPDTGAFSAGAQNTTQLRVVKSDELNSHIQIVGTIVTGPALVSAKAVFQPDEPA